MATIKEKLLQETEKPQNVILLHREGVFYIAYEHSAWLFCNFLHAFKVKKQYVKCVSQDVVSIGFPMSSLRKYINEDSIVADAGIARITIPDENISLTESFEQWRAQQALDIPHTGNKSSGVDVADKIASLSVIDRIKEFPLECKTPLECMLFLSEIKKLL